MILQLLRSIVRRTGLPLALLVSGCGPQAEQRLREDSTSQRIAKREEDRNLALKTISDLVRAHSASTSWSSALDTIGASYSPAQPFTVEIQDALGDLNSSFLIVGSIQDIWRVDGNIAVRVLPTIPDLEGIGFEFRCKPDLLKEVQPRGLSIFDEIGQGTQYAIVATYASAEPSPEIPVNTEISSGEESATVRSKPRSKVLGTCVDMKRLGSQSTLGPIRSLDSLQRMTGHIVP